MRRADGGKEASVLGKVDTKRKSDCGLDADFGLFMYKVCRLQMATMKVLKTHRA